MRWKKNDAISKANLLDDPEPLDCSWCAAECGAPTTDSPSICIRHEEMLMRQSAQRQSARHDIHAGHQRGTVRNDETLGNFIARKLGVR